MTYNLSPMLNIFSAMCINSFGIPYFSCRIKRIEQKDELETEKTHEYRDMELMEQDCILMREEIHSYTLKCESLMKFAAKHKVHIPPELAVVWTG